MGDLNSGPTVRELLGVLQRLLTLGKGEVHLWVDPPLYRDDTATLYAGEDDDEIASFPVN
jgi:hypothetical protein